MKKQLRKPENWQDFESLCKKLWGEIWSCPEIQKNGRAGDDQHGVDIYGIPAGENEYYGIQCKGKDDYTGSRLTRAEIDTEINKAKEFVPPLKKFYFATTSNKNSEVESYIRQKNIDNIHHSLFEIYLYSWEDIVDLIDENKHTHDWYLESQSFKSEHNIRFTFDDGSEELLINVPFLKRIVHYKNKSDHLPPMLALHETITKQLGMDNLEAFKKLSYRQPFFPDSVDKSNAIFSFSLFNEGSSPLRDFRIFLEFIGDFKKITICRKGHPMVPVHFEYDTFINSETRTAKIVPLRNILVGGDNIVFDDICLKPLHSKQIIKIRWNLVSLDFKQEGELALTVQPDFEIHEKVIRIEGNRPIRTDEIIEDKIVECSKLD